MKTKNTVSDEKGSVLVIALVMLALLTTLGIMSTNTTSIDLQIAQNERIHRQNFNMAEAANMLAVQRVINELEDLGDWNDAAYDWIHVCDENSAAGCAHPFRDTTDSAWTDDAITLTVNGLSAKYLAEYNGEFSGASIKVPATDKMYKFTCYGLYQDASRGEVLVETAMTRRF